MPPPTGVVSGPLMATRRSRIASTDSSGSQSLNWLKAFSPAKISNQAIWRLPPYAFLTAASKTSFEAFQMSRPVPSPSMKGMTGFSGNSKRPFLNSMACPSAGREIPLYEDRILYLRWIRAWLTPRKSGTSAVSELFKVSGSRAGAQSAQDTVEDLAQAFADAGDLGL